MNCGCGIEEKSCKIRRKVERMERKVYIRTILEWREKLYNSYVQYDIYIKMFLRFIMSAIIFIVVGSKLNYYEKLSNPLLILGLALVGTFVPDALLVFMVVVVTLLELYFLSPIIAGICALCFLFLYLMLARFDQKTTLALIFVPIFILWKIPVALVVVIALFFGASSVLTIVAGTCFYYILDAAKNIDINVGETTNDVFALIHMFMDAIIKNKNMYVMLMTLVAVFFITYFVRRLKMDFSFEMGVIAGGICGFILLLLGNVMLDSKFSILWVVLGSVVSCIIGLLVHFMHMVLDYGQKEKVQFEDDEYYYYVIAVPKMKMTVSNKKVKNIYTKKKR